MLVLLFAAGVAERWEGDCLKQIVPIAGEPVIARTERQLLERGHDVITITHEPEIQAVVQRFFVPALRRWWPETFLSSRELWEGRVITLHGDIVWQDSTLDTVLSSEGLHFYGTKRDTWENFAITFDPVHYDRMVKAAHRAIGQNGVLGKRCSTWEIYRSLVGIPLDAIRVFEKEMWIEIKPHGRDGDYTQDFDLAEHYTSFLEWNLWAVR